MFDFIYIYFTKFLNSYSFVIRKISGVTNKMCVEEVSTPPIIGNTIGFITSLPTPVAHSTGIRPNNATHTVISFGRRRFAAPAITNSLKSSLEMVSLEFPLKFYKLLHGIVQIDDHHDACFNRNTKQGDESDCYCNRKIYSIEIYHVSATDKCKWNCDQAKECFANRLESQIQ